MTVSMVHMHYVLSEILALADRYVDLQRQLIVVTLF